MLDRRRTRPAVVVVAALLLAGPCLPAGADPSNPTPAEIQAAKRQVADAKLSVQSLQVQAERATEVYNGARVRAASAQRRSDQAAARAEVADAAQARAEGVAAGARAASDAALAQVAKAKAKQTAAENEVVQAQRTLDGMAAGAYKSGGQSTVMTSLIDTTDPNDLARGQAYADRVGTYQRSVVDDLGKASNAAIGAAQVAAAAKATADISRQAADDALAQASAAQAVAASARSAAAKAVGSATAALHTASEAKARALLLVSRAERVLGNAKQRAAALAAAAAAAKREAAGVTVGKTSSAAAKTAIDAAMKWIGTPYSWGGGDENGPTYGFAQGAGTKGFDCSGLTLYAYAQAGIHLDHYTGSQWDQGKHVSRADLSPGDLMFFAYDTNDSSTIHHVSMYLGNGKMIEAPYTGEVVRVTSADRSDYIGATRPWA
jgi:cell wall-associated NlpC family hydrolase